MKMLDLDKLGLNPDLEADIAIVGAGPAGLTLASELAGGGRRIVVIESGDLQESPDHETLNAVIGEYPWSDAQIMRRSTSHGGLAPSWTHSTQPFGVRCRVVGGASHAWAGKSAIFDRLDFEHRPWVANSGWPLRRDTLDPYIERASARLNLGPNVYDDGLWSLLDCAPPRPDLNPDRLRSFFWQFARSRTDPFEAMRLGPEFLRAEAESDITLLVNATVTRVRVSPGGGSVEGLDAASLNGARARIRAPICVLAASGVENPRLLLASNDAAPAGLGNEYDLVGRFLMDHPAAQLAWFDRAAAPTIVKRFGFQGVPHERKVHMYMHGLSLTRETQEREGLLNAALFMLEDHAPDDPLLALKRLLKRSSTRWHQDLASVLTSPAPVAKSLAIKAMQSGRIPSVLQDSLINLIVRFAPNFAVREHLHRGVQYRLEGVRVEGITEQAPNSASRVRLSERRDALDVPMAIVDWRPGQTESRSLGRLGQIFRETLVEAGLPAPRLEDWVETSEFAAAPVIDMAHTLGTTRMAESPRHGVVDIHCRVHGVSGLYVAGGSVFPTSSHVNPTLMIVALAVRLADHLKTTVPPKVAVSAS